MNDTELLDWLEEHHQCELSYARWDDPSCWQVHKVTGNRNDQEWELVGEGETVREAILAASERLKRRGR